MTYGGRSLTELGHEAEAPRDRDLGDIPVMMSLLSLPLVWEVKGR